MASTATQINLFSGIYAHFLKTDRLQKAKISGFCLP